MKRTLALVVILSALPTFLIAQNNWRRMMDDRSANFFEIQADFELFHDSVMEDRKDIPKGLGIKQFRRWEHYWAARVDEQGNFPQEGLVLAEMRQYQAAQVSRSYETGTGNWTIVGPVALPANGTGQPNGNGRVNCLAFHPMDANTLYAGAPSGGLWKSTDNGATWAEYSSGLVRLGVSSIVVHPTQPDLMYIGTGDRDAGDAPGYGVWRSVDGGENWTAYNTGMGNRTVYEILMDPSDPLILIASTNDRIYRSVNGGANWTATYSGSEDFKDLAFHPGDPNIVYAAGNDYYRSTDNGQTWTPVTAGVPAGASRMALAVSADQPATVYLVAGDGGGLVGVFRSTDSGQTFTTQATSPNLFGYDVTGGTGSQAWYDCVAIADPNDGDHLTMGGINIWESFDAGVNWSLVAHWVGSGDEPPVHADQHAFEYSPHNGYLYNGNDGGVYYTSDAGVTWTDISSGLAIAQVYKIGVSQTVKDLVIHGYQDNGTAISESGDFRTEIGGDGMECIIDPTDAVYMYGALYYGSIRRSTNSGNSFGGITGGITEQGDWVTPYTLDPNDPARMVAGFQNVWRTDDAKSGTVTWTQISSFTGSSTIRDLAIAPSNSDVLYVARNGSEKFLRTLDAMAVSPSWVDLTGNLPSNTTPSDIAIDPTDPTQVLIALGSRVYRSNDGGGSWTDFSGTLPNITVNALVFDPNSPVKAMYLGNDAGVFYRDNTLSDWEPYSTGLPALEVTELEIFTDPNGCDQQLVASTYGQGTWKSDMKDPGNLAPVACFEAAPVNGCLGEVFTLTDRSSFTPTAWNWVITPGTYTFVNGTDANTQYPQVLFTTPGVYDVTLTATNGTGTDLRTNTGYLTVEAAATVAAHQEDFEALTLCGTASDCGGTICSLAGSQWANLVNGVEDDFDFRLDEGGTPSANTGPTADFAPGTATGNYLYVESSSCFGRRGVLQSACIDLDQAYDFTFAYHMSGVDMGELHLDIAINGAWQADVTPAIVGDQGTAWATRTVDLSAYTGSPVKLRFRAITGPGFTSDIALDDLRFTPTSVLVDVSALLEGPYDGSALMLPGVDAAPDFPLADPYPALGYVHTGLGNGGTLDPSLLGVGTTSRIIDWVLVELRDAVDPGVIVASRSGLVRADGTITELDNSSPLAFAVDAGNYYVAVRHRNHLGLMTAAPVALSSTVQTVPLHLSATATYGVEAARVAGDRQLLWAGDVSFDGQLKYTGEDNDRDPILEAIGGVVPTATATGYRQEDVDMSGEVKYTGEGNDRDPILQNIGGVVPTSIRQEQLP